MYAANTINGRLARPFQHVNLKKAAVNLKRKYLTSLFFVLYLL